MSEHDEPPMRVRIGKDEIELTRRNVSLYTFWGDLAMYNHVFVAFPQRPDESIRKGRHVFAGHDMYETLVELVMQKQYRQFLNMLVVSDGDRDAYVTQQALELESVASFPEDWTS